MKTVPRWTEEMSVGDDVIDAQHKDLFDLVALVAALAAKPALTPEDEAVVARAFTALFDYTRIHFRDEERLMAEAGFPALAEHIEEHRTFTEWLCLLEETRRSPGASLPEMLRHMSRYLSDWLTDHVLGVDKRYAPYIGKKK